MHGFSGNTHPALRAGGLIPAYARPIRLNYALVPKLQFGNPDSGSSSFPNPRLEKRGQVLYFAITLFTVE
jgi:hypothetical protein